MSSGSVTAWNETECTAAHHVNYFVGGRAVHELHDVAERCARSRIRPFTAEEYHIEVHGGVQVRRAATRIKLMRKIWDRHDSFE
eukprot:scaffold16367_cov124-Isochrysis_galbana.AAC.5